MVKQSKIDKKFIGTFGDFSFLSFNIMKNITSYTGGTMIINNQTFKNQKSKLLKTTKTKKVFIKNK